MQKNFVLAAALSLLIFVASAAAQDKATNFSGTWNLDVSRSKLGDRNMIESQTLTVTQTEKDIKIETATKRLPPPADAPQGGRMGGGLGGGDSTTTYTLDGKMTKTSVEGPMGVFPIELYAKVESSNLKLTRTGSFNTPMGSMVISTLEIWSLGQDGKTLTIKRTQDSPRGITTSELIFNKK